MSLILFGFKGSGKTYFGKKAADLLKKQFIDTDEILQASAQKPVRSLYERLGEASFREFEKHSLMEWKYNSNAVIALGGGTLMTAELIVFFQNLGHLIYLDASFETLKRRILSQALPAFVDQEDPLASLYSLYQERKKIYESILAKRIDADQPDTMILSELISYGV
jgi:shikimate kinase